MKDTSDETMRTVADDAIEHIFKLRYFADLRGEVQLYSIATRQTDAFVSYRKIYR